MRSLGGPYRRDEAMFQKSPKPKTSKTEPLSREDARVRARYVAWGLGEEDESAPQAQIGQDPFENKTLERIKLFYYLIPVVGLAPSLWTMYRRQGSSEQIAASRLAVTLALCWFSGYVLLETGAKTAEFMTLPLLLTSSLLTSSYFLVNLWLMIRLFQGRSLKVSGISRILEQVVGKRRLR